MQSPPPQFRVSQRDLTQSPYHNTMSPQQSQHHTLAKNPPKKPSFVLLKPVHNEKTSKPTPGKQNTPNTVAAAYML